MVQRRKECGGEIPLAVGVVRRMESLLTKVSRKRRLTTEHRQSLLKCVAYLKQKRRKQTQGKITIPWLIWVQVLRFLAVLIENRDRVKKIVDEMLGVR